MNQATQKTLFSSNSSEWATPQEFFDKLDYLKQGDETHGILGKPRGRTEKRL